MLADYRSGLLDAVPQSHLLAAGAVNRNNANLEESIKALAINLQKRLPTPESDHRAVSGAVVVERARHRAARRRLAHDRRRQRHDSADGPAGARCSRRRRTSGCTSS